ncbi:hypothetical protein DFH08DRAFT_827706 [Mycena albidolilacea]|uniref:Uncharacterized protein n=1 Tax=Mycena albidolilacea TaxID=1033008 RepID=A0AAD6YXH9_9AGAR|nr:hypothetical protein DFH08DRAFT_827706 [Mycena albidolilacea]
MLGRVEQHILQPVAIVVTLANKKDITGHKLAPVPVPVAGRVHAAPWALAVDVVSPSLVPRTAVGVATAATERICTHPTPLVVPVAPPKPPLPDDGVPYDHAMHAHAPVLMLVVPPCPLCEPHWPRPQEGVTWGLDSADAQDRVRGEGPQACRRRRGAWGEGKCKGRKVGRVLRVRIWAALKRRRTGWKWAGVGVASTRALAQGGVELRGGCLTWLSQLGGGNCVHGGAPMYSLSIN